MPNHFHAIIAITNQQPVGANGCSPTSESSPTLEDFSSLKNRHQSVTPSMKPRSLSSLIAGFKCATITRINTIRNTPGSAVWQRNYYEHIVRNESSLEKICQYIQNNPTSWHTDRLHSNIPSKW